MISLENIEKTAQTLMAKAAIEIPQDYHDGLKTAAQTETGDLSSFVLQAMLDNYEAAKQDRRAMCGDTGVPCWYVKMGNEARIARLLRLKPPYVVPLLGNMIFPCVRTGCIRYGGQIMIIMLALALLKSNLALSRRGMD